MRVSVMFQPASAGFQMRSGTRQSMPSINMASCAGDSVMEPSYPVIRGHTNPPRSSRLVNKHSPLPSQNRTLTICARLPLKANRWPENGSFFQRLLDEHGQSIHALSHVGVTQRQVHLHARRNDHHRAASW
jgi:hypothetical protein